MDRPPICICVRTAIPSPSSQLLVLSDPTLLTISISVSKASISPSARETLAGPRVRMMARVGLAIPKSGL